MQEVIQLVLIENGWSLASGSAIAIKEFDTVVGPKEAHAYLSFGDGINRTLFGNYDTEGHNELENCLVLIPVEADKKVVSELALKFSEYAENAVSQSYAVKLLRSKIQKNSG